MSDLDMPDRDHETSLDNPNAEHAFEPQAPDTSNDEMKLAALKSIIQLFPVAGGSIAELVGAALIPIIRHRYEAWVESVFREIHRRLAGHDELLERYEPEKLFQSEAFVSAFLRMSQTAIQTHEQEKLDILRDAAVNVALGDEPDESLQSMFLESISVLTPWHIRLLSCIADPVAWAERYQYDLAQGWTPDARVIFEGVYREKLPNKGLDDRLLKDLYTRGLAANDVDPWGQLFPRSAESTIPHITDLGRLFLKFIAAPKPEQPTQQPNETAQEHS